MGPLRGYKIIEMAPIAAGTNSRPVKTTATGFPNVSPAATTKTL